MSLRGMFHGGTRPVLRYCVRGGRRQTEVGDATLFLPLFLLFFFFLFSSSFCFFFSLLRLLAWMH